MRLTDLINEIMLISGEFIVGDLANTQIDVPLFYALVKRTLRDYSRWKPRTAVHKVQLNSNSYQFDTNDKPASVQSVSTVPFGILMSGFHGSSSVNYWEYNRETGVLDVVGLLGAVNITAHYDTYPTVETRDETTGVLIDAEISGVRQETLFLDLLQGNFLIALGRSRRAFTLNDLPVSMDADQLVGEGQSLVEQTIERLQDNSDWHHVIY